MSPAQHPRQPTPIPMRRSETDTTKTVWIPKTVAELNLHYASGQGKLVVDPQEAEAEFGKELASQLKLDKTGRIILWPQPDQSVDDPQNWPKRKKIIHLIILTMAAFIPDFCSGIGIPLSFNLAQEYGTTPSVINNTSLNWSIFLLGPGGIFSIFLAKRYGRLPVLFWSQLVGLAFLIGCAVAPDLKTFAAMRCLNAFFSSAPQVMGLFIVNDLYPFHLQARILNLWTSGFLCSPFVGPWLFGYLVSRISWRWSFWIASMYVGAVLVLIAIFMEETIYDRFSPHNIVREGGLKGRFSSLAGVTGYKTAKYRASWAQAVKPMIQLLGRPHLLAILLYSGLLFGFGIGVNVTNVIFTRSPPPLGFGLSTDVAASLYLVPTVAVFLGEIVGRYLNDGIASRLTHRNSGVFEPEMRLWTLYFGLLPFVGGFVLLGAAYQEKLPIAAVVFGLGLAQIGIMISTVACYNYANNAFAFPGEIAALLNQARILGGFATPYFQVEWATSRGALETFGCEAAIICGLFILIVPFLQIKGGFFREKFALYPSEMDFRGRSVSAKSASLKMGKDECKGQSLPVAEVFLED